MKLAPGTSCVAAIVPGDITPDVIVPAETVFTVVPSVVSTPFPETLQELSLIHI